MSAAPLPLPEPITDWALAERGVRPTEATSAGVGR